MLRAIAHLSFWRLAQGADERDCALVRRRIAVTASLANLQLLKASCEAEVKFDLSGRIENMRLPDGKAAILYSVYEAVSNALHAIDDRFGDEAPSKGSIEIDIETDKDGITRISVADNGIGLTPANLAAFETCDTRNKRSRGGKGIGRLIWFKTFDKIKVRSGYSDGASVRELAFTFTPEEDQPFKKLKQGTGTEAGRGTTIALSVPLGARAMKRASFLRDLALHFFSYFIAGSMPQLSVRFSNRDPVDLREYITARIEHSESAPLTVSGVETTESLEIVHIYVNKNISKNLKNSILLVGHNRQVEQIPIGPKFSLNLLAERRGYVALVRGAFLDNRVDQERTGFKMTEEQHSAVHEAALASAEAFLGDHISQLRATQRITVGDLIAEHPQLALKVGDINAYVATLSPGMGEEDIGKTLFTLLYRDERKIAREVESLSNLDSLTDEAMQRVSETVAKIGDQAKHRLAEYVVKRRQIIDLAKSFLKKRTDAEKHFEEKAIHDLIVPMKRFYNGDDLGDHNLWIVDDLLAFYQFFASDKTLQSFLEDSKDGDEPDVIFFNPMGFQREGTSDPVVLVEFKRPGDERMSSDPIDQVLGYIEKLRGKTVRHGVTNETISEIGRDTPFLCYVMCDLTENARRMLGRSIACHPTPDGEGYFGYAPQHHALIHVLSYRKMLRDAELRNRAFFKHLGIEVS